MDFIKKSSETFIAHIFILLLNIISGVVVARMLGPSGRGVYAIVLMLHVLLTTLGSLGIGNANIYHIGRKKYPLNQIFTNSIVFSIGLGIIIIALVFILSYGFSFENTIRLSRVYLLSVTLIVPISLLSSYLNSIFLGLQQVKIFNLLTVSKSLIFLFLVIFFTIIFKLYVIGVVVSLIISEIIILLLGLYNYFQLEKSSKVKFVFYSEIVKDSLIFGSKGHIGTIAQILNYRVDVFILALFLLPKEIGYYAIAFGLVEKLLIIPNVIGLILLPKASSMTDKEFTFLIPKVARVSLFLGVALCLMLFLFSKLIIVVMFGRDYLPCLLSLWILLPGMIFLTIHKILTNALAGYGMPEASTYATSVSLLFNIVGNIILIPKIGIEGAALASTITYLINAAILIIIFCYKTRLGLGKLLLITHEDVNEILTNIKKTGLLFKVH